MKKVFYIPLCLGLSAMPLLAVTYHEPSDDLVMIRTDRLPIDADTMKWLSHQLVIIAERESPGTAVDMRTNAQLIALAQILDNENREAKRFNDLLKRGQSYDTTSTDQVTKATSRVWSLVNFLANKEAGDEANLLADCIKDTMLVIDPKHPSLSDFRISDKRWEGKVAQLEKFKDRGRQIADTPRVTDEPIDPPVIAKNDDEEMPKKPQQDDLTEDKPSKWHTLTGTFISPVQEYLRVDDKHRYRDEITSVSVEIQPGKADKEKNLQFECQPSLQHDGKLGKLEYEIKKKLSNEWKDLPNAKIKLKLKNSLSNRDQKYLVSNLLVFLDSSLADNKYSSKTLTLTNVDDNGDFSRGYSFWHTMRLVAATEEGRRILVPQHAEDDLRQLIALEKPEFFVKNEIIVVNSLKEARSYSGKLTDPKIKEACELYAEFQEVAESRSIGALTANKHVRERLEKILALMPNHISAKMLLLQGSGQRPIKLESKFLAYELDDITSDIVPIIREAAKFGAKYSDHSDKIDVVASKMEKELEVIKNYVDSADDAMYETAEDLVSNLKILSRAVSRNRNKDYDERSGYYARLIKNTTDELTRGYENLDAQIVSKTKRMKTEIFKDFKK
ncbi:hypothetical protein SAMN02745181_0252 [Rubritalea squalenifaciens DSM 18772]|uniref:Uncharacterized protein n=1 Tax=Rubritalea squalenifaciens DSM 18772 TaxID=1123071 RepID=A0A1M6BL30_9BACT|nr:hypothetical protein [Rubritalea squalenifaciens]SHI49500.1 hypothetical protein SAMN02745181_0252 [Rubritalea squalenifaciens DSM 18772]